MAHFAKIENGVVVQVIVVHDNDLLEVGLESEAKGLSFLAKHYPGTEWVQTSYNGTKRKNYAGIGYTHDKARDAFIPPKHYSSWVLDEKTARYEAPVIRPAGEKVLWDEPSRSWKDRP